MNEPYFDSADIEKNKVIAALAYLGILFFLPLVACPDSQFGRFHANQALVLLILSFIGGLLNIIPLVGWILGGIVSIFCFVMFLYGLINTLQGHAKELPLIGQFKLIS